MKKILFLTQFSALGGSSRIQVIQFLPLLEQAGIACVHRHMYPDSFYRIQMRITRVGFIRRKLNLVVYLLVAFLKKWWYALTAFRFDSIVIQKETFPKALLSLALFMNSRIVYEIDDTIFEVNPFLNQSKIEGFLLRYQAKLCINMMKRSAWVIAENEYLATEARKHNTKVSVLSAPIDVLKYYPLKSDEERKSITIGWIGSPSTTAMLEAIAPAIEEVLKRFPEARLKVVGAADTFSIAGMLQKKGWSAEEELADLQSFDIGLMPLDDTPFQRGRLGYKMIQYMSVGIPIVASNVGLNPTVIKNGDNGFLVGSKEAWQETLSKLIKDPALRKNMGARGREMAVKQFSLESKAKIYLDVFNRLSNRHD